MKRADFTILSEPRGTLYRRLLRAGLGAASVVGLVIRSGMPMASGAGEVLALLAPHAISDVETTEWPGTRLLSGGAHVYRFKFTEEVANILGRTVDGLYDWCAPALPEDLFLERSDGTVWLATIAHERDSYLNHSDDDYTALVLEVPEIAHSLQRT